MNETAKKEKSSEIFIVRMTPTEKSAMFKAAGGKRKASQWVKNILNRFTHVV